MDYKDIAGQNGANNQGGKVVELYLAAYSKFVSIKEPAATTGAGDTAKIITAHTFAGTDGFAKIMCAQNKTKHSINSVGDADGGGFEQTLEVELAGNSAEKAEFVSRITGDQFIALNRDPNDAVGTYDELGIAGSPATVSVKYDSGTPGGEKRYVLTIKSWHRPLKYTSTVTPQTYV